MSSGGQQELRRIFRLRRNRGGVLLGLCGGIGKHLGVDPVLVRLAFVLLVTVPASGLGVILVYLLFCLFIPYEPDFSDQ
jgi:phage shock protein PspC (stress-responsive transcriptional regulator)